MKVLYTLDSLNRGGAETRVLDICRNAKRFGIHLTFVATGGGILEKEFENAGVDYIRLQRDFAIDLNLVWKLRKIITERNIQIVQGFQPVEVLHLYLATIGLKNVKCVLTHEGFIEGNKNRWTAKFLAPLVDANISVSRALFPWLRKEIGVNTSKNFYLVYNGIDLQRLEPRGKSIKEELGFSEDSLLLGMVANFRPDNTKDQLTVCRALPEVLEKHKNANFIFVGKVTEGSEDYFDECIEMCDENGIGEKVYFLGGRDDVKDILADLDLFVFSSLNEGLPISVIEAMLTKVPVIISDIPQLLETTNNGKCAEVFKTKNATDLSDKILKLLKDNDLQENLTEEAFKFAKQTFSIEAHFRVLKTLYLDLLSDLDSDENQTDKTTDKEIKNDSDSIFGLD